MDEYFVEDLMEKHEKHVVMIKMDKRSKITIDVPENVPSSLLKRKFIKLVKEEALKWALFEKCKDEILLTEDELKVLEKVRETTWKETKKDTAYNQHAHLGIKQTRFLNFKVNYTRLSSSLNYFLQKY